MNNTPLRYPGGKSVMTPLIEDIININEFENIVYAEPYSGGAGSAINLLLEDKVEAIKINDISLGIYSFWESVVNHHEDFLRKFEEASINLEEWNKQRAIFKNSTCPSVDLGFATFFLSRTNRSGILNAGPIGGQDPEKQLLAKYKIDCRFNKEALLEKIEAIIERRNSIEVFNKDALRFLREDITPNDLVYLDPPYYNQGKALYLNYYTHNDHFLLAEYLKNENRLTWLLSYDNVSEIHELYSGFDLYEFSLIYTAQNVKEGTEFFTHSRNIRLPDEPLIRRSTRNIPLVSI